MGVVVTQHVIRTALGKRIFTGLQPRRLGRLVAGLPFHFIAQAPEQDGGVILVAEDHLAHGIQLLFEHCGVIVAELLGVVLVMQPDANGDGEPVFLRLIKQRRKVVTAPSANGIGPRLDEQIQPSRTARAFHEIRFAVALEAPPIGGVDEFRFDRGCEA